MTEIDSSLDCNFTRSSGGKNAAPLFAVSTLLVSVLAHFGEFTNWWIIDGTSCRSVTLHLYDGVIDRRNHVMESRAYFGMSSRAWVTSHLGMMRAVHGAAKAWRPNAVSP